jgi:hypothetical protein
LTRESVPHEVLASVAFGRAAGERRRAFFLATQVGTRGFFGQACAEALLPHIPVVMLVGGAGSTVFAMTKVWIEQRSLSWLTALTLLLVPALGLTLLLVLLGAIQSPGHRLAYICLGNTARRRPAESKWPSIRVSCVKNGWPCS